MRPLNDVLAARILAAAKDEFLDKGYRNASVRCIAAAAGVTTGALYRYYSNKEALFDALMSAPAEEFYRRYKKYSDGFSSKKLDDQLATLPEISVNPNGDISLFMKYIYENYDAFKLIACCSAGTKYEDYAERLIDIETKSGTVLVRLMQKEGRLTVDADDMLIHIISSTLFTGVFEIISHDANAADAERHINALRAFYTAGWYEMLGI